MREIKFRGKSLDSGEWYYGNLYDKDTAGRTHIGTTNKGCLNIDPETVGQYTGLKDKNGKEIYEGDVVIQHGHGINDIQGCVTYDPSSAMFVLSYETYGCMHTETLQSKKVYNDYNTQFSVEHTFEVIGNIHDNPELLEQREPNQNEL